MNDSLYAIDSSVYIFRSYFALKPQWQSVDGRPTETVYGFTAFLLKFLALEKPVFAAAAFDESLGSGFRHRLYPDYKANRALPDESLAFQLRACKEVAAALGLPTFSCEEYEADDYLATMAACARDDQQVYLLSRDKDLAQLLRANVSLWDYGYGEPISADAYRASKSLEPRLVPDYLALVGDSSDNIPGVPGIGAKTATAILSSLGAIDQWIDSPGTLATLSIRGCAKLPEKIANHKGQLCMAKILATLRPNAEAIPDLSVLCWKGIDYSIAENLFDELGLGGLKQRLFALAQ